MQDKVQKKLKSHGHSEKKSEKKSESQHIDSEARPVDTTNRVTHTTVVTGTEPYAIT